MVTGVIVQKKVWYTMHANQLLNSFHCNSGLKSALTFKDLRQLLLVC